MPVVQKGKYFNINLEPGEFLPVQKQYEGEGKISSTGNYRYSFITNEGNSASAFVSKELSDQIAPLPVGTNLILKKDKDEGQFGKISATLADGAPLFTAAPKDVQQQQPLTPAQGPEAPKQAVPVSRDHSIAWQNANNTAAAIVAQIPGDLGQKMDAFKVAHESIYGAYIEKFYLYDAKKTRLLAEAETLFDGDKK